MSIFKRCSSKQLNIKQSKRGISPLTEGRASVDNLKMIHRSGWTFYTNLKSNRKLSITKEVGYQDLEEFEWRCEELISGRLVKIKEVPFWLKLFKLVDTNGNIEWVITNKLAEDFTVTGR